MRTPSVTRSLIQISLFAGAVFLLAASASAGVKVAETEDFTLELGMRLQPRLEFARIPAGGEFARDFLVRRSRWKANGKMQKATYVFEWKIDGTDGIGSTPSASVENGYVQYPLGAGVDVRAGLYDQPFSRDRLTSDSKQLVVDRGAVSNVPDALGLADNVVGVQVLGKVRGGRALYTVGLFDNRFIPGALQDLPMVVGRLDLNLGATKDLYQDAHFGDDKWYSLGLNGSYQAELEDPSGADEGSRGAVGVDGMMDVPAGAGRALLRGEFNVIEVVEPTGGNGIDTRVWMVGAGYLIDERIQPVVRFDQVLLDDAAGGGSRNITYAGINFYKKQHSLKLQADLRFESGTGEAVDGGRLQAQIDF